jgi:DNA polymerase-3 subunit delta'
VADYLDDVVGQDAAKKFIRTGIKKDNLYNILFTGPRGVGKRMFGFALAKTLGCPPNSPNFHLIAPIPSKLKDKSDKIHEYSKNYYPENAVVETKDRASILIEQIRNVTERLMHMPESGKKRVVLILNADQMTDEAANCFLKTLEEPPIDTIFLLTSSRPEFVLPTIRSRCRVIPFTHLGVTQIGKIVYDGKDDFMLGSPGEILSLRESGMVESVMEIFKKTPLQVKSAAIVAQGYERKNIVELYYPLLLLYRLVLYRKLNLVSKTRYEYEIAKKAKRITLDKVIETIALLNNNICLLERNPNRLLHLFNVLLRLP